MGTPHWKNIHNQKFGKSQCKKTLGHPNVVGCWPGLTESVQSRVIPVSELLWSASYILIHHGFWVRGTCKNAMPVRQISTFQLCQCCAAKSKFCGEVTQSSHQNDWNAAVSIYYINAYFLSAIKVSAQHLAEVTWMPNIYDGEPHGPSTLSLPALTC